MRMTTKKRATGVNKNHQEKSIKIASTKALAQLNILSVAKGYNRNLSDQFFLDADPKGIHVLSVLMIHEHAEMRPVPLHFRCMVLAKMQGKRTPTPVILDIPMQSFHALQEAV